MRQKRHFTRLTLSNRHAGFDATGDHVEYEAPESTPTHLKPAVMHRVLLTVAALLAAHAHAHAHASIESEVKEAHVQHAVQLSLLHLFGFKSRPRPRRETSTPAHVPPTMFQLYRRQRHLAADGIHFVRRDSSTANTVRSFIHSESPEDNVYSDPHRFRYRFNISGIPTSEDPRAAELRLYREASPSSTNSLQRVHVYDVLHPSRDDTMLRLVDTRVINSHHSGWETFDVLPIIRRWRRDPNHNHGVIVHVTSNNQPVTSDVHVRLRRSPTTTDTTWLSTQPVLLVFTDDGRTSKTDLTRRRRSPNYHQQRPKRRKGHSCQRHKLYVDFSDVGWNDWIVAPPGYEAFYCQGDCPFPLADHLNATNHAIVQTLVNSVKPKAVPKACCVPTELTPISMLYLDEYDKVVLKNYQDMVVVGCGCR